jgi:hypothetical protein
MHRIKVLLGFSLLFCALDLTAQVSYEKHFRGSGIDAPTSTCLLAGDGMIIGGATNSFGNGANDMSLTRLDANGNVIWTKAVGTAQNDTCNSVIITTDSFIVACGNTYGGGLGNSDLYINKLDMNGQLVWSKVFGSANYDWSLKAFPTHDSGFVLTGYINYPPVFTPVMNVACNSFLMKFDRNGNIVWTQYYASLSCHNMVYDAVQYPNGDFMMLVHAYCQASPPSYQSAYYVIRTDSLGQIRWRKKDYGFAYAFVMLPTSDNGTYFAYSTGIGTVQTLKIDSMGVPQTAWRYGYFTQMSAPAAFEVPGNGYLMIGHVQPDQLTAPGYLFFRIGANGYPLWTKYHPFDSALVSYPYFNTKQRSDGMLATVSGLGTNTIDFAVLVTDTAGYTICGNDSDLVVYTTSIALPVFTDEPQINANPTLLTGSATTNVMASSYMLGSICAGSGPSGTAEADAYGINIFPNPADDVIRIEWNESTSGREVVLHAVTGEVVYKAACTGTATQLDVSALAPGLYFLSLQVEGTVLRTGKLVIE